MPRSGLSAPAAARFQRRPPPSTLTGRNGRRGADLQRRQATRTPGDSPHGRIWICYQGACAGAASPCQRRLPLHCQARTRCQPSCKGLKQRPGQEVEVMVMQRRANPTGNVCAGVSTGTGSSVPMREGSRRPDRRLDQGSRRTEWRLAGAGPRSYRPLATAERCHLHNQFTPPAHGGHGGSEFCTSVHSSLLRRACRAVSPHPFPPFSTELLGHARMAPSVCRLRAPEPVLIGGELPMHDYPLTYSSPREGHRVCADSHIARCSDWGAFVATPGALNTLLHSSPMATRCGLLQRHQHGDWCDPGELCAQPTRTPTTAPC
jgi:hypothetical protein